LEYFPLKVGTVQGRLELSSNDLGQFPYELNLKAVAAANERELQLRASIGTTQTVTARFVSYARTRADYVCKVCLATLLFHRSNFTGNSSHSFLKFICFQYFNAID